MRDRTPFRRYVKLIDDGVDGREQRSSFSPGHKSATVAEYIAEGEAAEEAAVKRIISIISE